MDWQAIRDWTGTADASLLLLGAVAVLLGWNLWLTLRWRTLQKRWRELMTGSEGNSLERLLYETLRRVSLMDETLKVHGNHLQQLQSQTDRCIQQVGLLRYDAFPDSGGQQSFAIALLNRHGDGIVLSGIHSRQEMRVYAKPIHQLRSAIGLSEEERLAIQEAVERRREAEARV
ncbi:MAG: DUF4446 family protein [Fimbriimonadales bacterium]|nr:DUF4446 family protein [Fimbriimonadales bacterium]